MDNRPWQRHYDYNVPLTIRYPRVPAHYFLNIPAGNFPNKTATNFYGTEITFIRRLPRQRPMESLMKTGVRP
ncbi:MAG: hypothetical protein HKO68_06030 [Desulfobacterales bacterium]|nr:hypothetical protein [Desulfobacterales bacterium]